MQSTFGLAIVFMVASVGMSIAFLVTWIRHFREANRYFYIGLTFVLVFVAVDMTAFFLTDVDYAEMSLLHIGTVVAITLIRIYVFTVVGLMFVERLHQLRIGHAPTELNTPQFMPLRGLALSKTAVTCVLAAFAFMMFYTFTLFYFSNATLGAAIDGSVDLGTAVPLAGLVAVAAIGFGEEIIFRLGLQNGFTYLMRRSPQGHRWAILITTTIWMIGHVGVVEPEWVKMAQIFVFGLILGHMNWRFGVVPCMITHVLFNIAMAKWSPALLGA